MLGFYGLHDWQVIKVDDSNPSATFTGQLTDFTNVEKFEITEEEYAQRRGMHFRMSIPMGSPDITLDTVLAFKQRNKMGRFGEAEAKPDTPVSTEVVVGARCEVDSTDADLRKRGTVRFVGPTKFAAGVWVGIEYDEPLGKNDGSVNGERYFSCRNKYGVFVRGDKVQVGDFPVEELDLELDEEEM
jgi:tubulin-folding cofactor B